MLIKSETKVEKLTKRVENLYDQRQADEDKRAREEARLKIINDATKWTKTDFWCNSHGDTTGLAFKVIFQDIEKEFYAYYETVKGNRWPKHIQACCKGLRRRITDKNTDPYFLQSKMIRKQAQESKAKGWLLQPGQEGFNTKYGDPNKKKYAQQEKQDRANWQKKIISSI